MGSHVCERGNDRCGIYLGGYVYTFIVPNTLRFIANFLLYGVRSNSRNISRLWCEGKSKWGPGSYATRSLIACKQLTKHGWERKLLRLRWRRSDAATRSSIFKHKSLQAPKESHCAKEEVGMYKPEKLYAKLHVQKVIILIYLCVLHWMWRTQRTLGRLSPRGTGGKVDKSWCLQLRLTSPGFCQGLTVRGMGVEVYSQGFGPLLAHVFPWSHWGIRIEPIY